jgi:hypothetical protein
MSDDRYLLLVRSRRGSIGLKCPQNLVEIGADANLVVFEIIQPQIVAAVGLSQEGKQIAKANANAGRLPPVAFQLEGARVDAQVSGHAVLLGLTRRCCEDRLIGVAAFGKTRRLGPVRSAERTLAAIVPRTPAA